MSEQIYAAAQEHSATRVRDLSKNERISATAHPTAAVIKLSVE